MLVLLMDENYEGHDTCTTSHGDRFTHSSNILVITTTIWETVMLVFLIGIHLLLTVKIIITLMKRLNTAKTMFTINELIFSPLVSVSLLLKSLLVQCFKFQEETSLQHPALRSKIIPGFSKSTYIKFHSTNLLSRLPLVILLFTKHERSVVCVLNLTDLA
jgi:hypothetical protein